MGWLPLFLWWYEEDKRMRMKDDKDDYDNTSFVVFKSDYTIKDRLFIIIPTLIIILVDIIGYLWAFGYIKF